MRNVLVISSATKKAYICLKTDVVEDFCEIDANCKQSENILLQTDAILSKNNMAIEDIDDIAVVIGPGSFTGIRIGVALVKGFCAANKKINVYPLSTLDFMAYNIPKNKIKSDFMCILNALSGLLFVKEYDSEGKPMSEERMIECGQLNDFKGDIFGIEEETVCENKVELKCEMLLRLALDIISTSKPVLANQISPIYLRNSQAEENLKKIKKTY